VAEKRRVAGLSKNRHEEQSPAGKRQQKRSQLAVAGPKVNSQWSRGEAYLTWNLRVWGNGSAPTEKVRRYDPVVNPFVLRLKMYPPVGPSVESNRKSLSGLALPEAWSVSEEFELACTRLTARTTTEELETSALLALQSWTLSGIVLPL